MKDQLTKKQQSILNFIVGFIAKNGYAPSLREIASKFKLKSLNGVNDHLKALEKKGAIKRTNMRARSIVVQ